MGHCSDVWGRLPPATPPVRGRARPYTWAPLHADAIGESGRNDDTDGEETLSSHESTNILELQNQLDEITDGQPPPLQTRRLMASGIKYPST